MKQNINIKGEIKILIDHEYFKCIDINKIIGLIQEAQKNLKDIKYLRATEVGEIGLLDIDYNCLGIISISSEEIIYL